MTEKATPSSRTKRAGRTGQKGERKMNENIVKRNEKLAQKVIKGLESRNMKGYYAASKEEALEMALKMIPVSAPILASTSVPLFAMEGLFAALRIFLTMMG